MLPEAEIEELSADVAVYVTVSPASGEGEGAVYTVAVPLCVVVVESVPQGADGQSSVQVKLAPEGPVTAWAYKFVVVPGLIWALSLQTDA